MDIDNTCGKFQVLHVGVFMCVNDCASTLKVFRIKFRAKEKVGKERSPKIPV